MYTYIHTYIHTHIYSSKKTKGNSNKNLQLPKVLGILPEVNGYMMIMNYLGKHYNQ